MKIHAATTGMMVLLATGPFFCRLHWMFWEKNSAQCGQRFDRLDLERQ